MVPGQKQASGGGPMIPDQRQASSDPRSGASVDRGGPMVPVEVPWSAAGAVSRGSPMVPSQGLPACVQW